MLPLLSLNTIINIQYERSEERRVGKECRESQSLEH